MQRSPESRNSEEQAVLQLANGPRGISVCSSQYAAMDPGEDDIIRASNDSHQFVAVLSASPTAPAWSYLHRKLYPHLQAQLELLEGHPSFLQAAFANLDAAWRRIHPFNQSILEGVAGLSIALIDIRRQTLHLASHGACRAAAGDTHGRPVVTAERLPASNSVLVSESLPVGDVSCVLLGSVGLWRELGPSKALLRLQALSHLHDADFPVPSPAAHLTNYALHAVTQRMQRRPDPRMRALSSVTALQSLWVGSRANTKGHSLVRRRRGDVHGDLSAVVLQLQPLGAKPSQSAARGADVSPAAAQPDYQPLSHQAPANSHAAARWALLRMHFLGFPKAARQHAHQRWHHTVAAACAQAAPAVSPPASLPAHDAAAAVPVRMSKPVAIFSKPKAPLMANVSVSAGRGSWLAHTPAISASA